MVLINATETFKKKKMERENEEKEEENNRDDEETSSNSSRVINMALIAREHRVKMERLVEQEEKEKEEANNNKSLLESALGKWIENTVRIPRKIYETREL